MSRVSASDRRRSRQRLRPNLMALEDRRLLSTFTVNSVGDVGTGSGLVGDLRYCITQANSAGGDETITFDNTVFKTPQTIKLSGTQLELSDTTGAVTITGPAAGVTVSGNNASRVFQIDGGVAASISGMTITGGSTDGSGGGLDNEGGTLTLTDCTVSGNSAIINGGGVYTTAGGMTSLTDCTVSGNSALQAGVFVNSGTTLLTGCTVSGNVASYGAGVYNSQGTLTLTNCTVSGNTASISGGGVYSRGTTTLTNCTVSSNSSNYNGGITIAGGTVDLTNTIVAGQASGGDIGGGSYSGSNNLIGGNPLLAPLGNYGGPMQTMALLPGSPAIDAGTSGAGIPTTDERGAPRVGSVDIGAFESQGFTLNTVAGSTPQTAAIGSPFAKPLTVTVTPNNPAEPVDGGVVSFVANRSATGATAFFLPPPAVIAGGRAAATAAPNNALGSYTVVASVTGSSPVSFALTNSGKVFTNLVVNTTKDSLLPGTGLLSLREAITFANLDSLGNSSISFDSKVFKTPQVITLTGGQLELSNTSEVETITGPTAYVTILGNLASRVFQIDPNVASEPLAADDRRRHDRRQRRRPEQPGHGHAHQLHHQRQHR